MSDDWIKELTARAKKRRLQESISLSKPKRVTLTTTQMSLMGLQPDPCNPERVLRPLNLTSVRSDTVTIHHSPLLSTENNVSISNTPITRQALQQDHRMNSCPSSTFRAEYQLHPNQSQIPISSDTRLPWVCGNSRSTWNIRAIAIWAHVPETQKNCTEALEHVLWQTLVNYSERLGEDMRANYLQHGIHWWEVRYDELRFRCLLDWCMSQIIFIQHSCNENVCSGLFRPWLLRCPILKFGWISTVQLICSHGKQNDD